ncbi:PREDICTED: protein spire isoform X1 [Trachymyrmex cornetzi]|uniref:protein spire isoform X1 n=1 Tax=Trachymyrmex cornetzi TaxID=471704 RepID=UPI00084F6289|nr:PREDICTED: protein spire isoform X1 [Trachymyrmex cornetzi]XP_018373875.1 PREDICTED: protein spire isoform X1 [Trachymyrmex cornetzi]
MSNSKNSTECNKKKATVLEEPQTAVNKKEDASARPMCKLDSCGCLNLQDILLIFDSPLSQERAWALCYQIANGLLRLTENKFYEISELSQIILHKDGDIWLENLAGSKPPLVSEEKVVFSLGMAIFKALDFGSNAGEEISLLPDLEALITSMTNCNRVYEGDVEERLQETDDEGIERDSGDTDAEDYMMPKPTESYTDSPTCTLKTILQICARHAQSLHENADNYYRNIIQAFVEEALNLSQFLERVVVNKQSQDLFDPNNVDRSSTSLQNINTVDFNDWTDIRIWRAIQARFWVQVISELRRGVKLKKVEANLDSRMSSREERSLPDYKLTPYESLMDDIRARRYRLRKTPPTSSRKDAHAIILEFIRSRPSLKKASERRLRPLQKESTLRELLMESIKKPPKPLRSSGSRQNASKIEEISICNVSGESHMIVLGEVPPSQPDQEQESAQDVAAQWLQSEDQRTLATGESILAAASQRRQDVPPVPQPRQRIAKERSNIRILPFNRNRKSRRRRITVSDIAQNGEDINKRELLPKPSGRNLDVAKQTKKVIPVDFDLKLDAEDDDDDYEDDYNEENFMETRFEEEDEICNYWQLKDNFGSKKGVRNGHKDHDHARDDDEEGSANPWRKTGGLRLTRNEYHRFCDAQLESYDLATQCPSRRASARRHAAKCTVPQMSFTGTTSLPQSRPHSRQHAGLKDLVLSQGPSPNISLNPSPNYSPQPRTSRQAQLAHAVAHENKNDKAPDDEWDDIDKKGTLGDMLLDERLSLTLDEIVHIRSVLTKAELESLPVEGRVKEDVEKRRVCFLCLKTRFGLLGPWGQRCRLCKRTVCVKCYSKMRIPTEQFARVPVVLLSPGLLLSPTETENESSKNSWLGNTGAVGSAPASPASRRKDSALRSGTPTSTPTMTPISTLTPTSTPSHVRRDVEVQGLEKRCYKGGGSPAALSTTKTFSTSSGPSAEQRMAAERLRGVAVVVCHDCRIMVIQIIKSSRTTRATIRNNVISRLTLNLSPAYI